METFYCLLTQAEYDGLLQDGLTRVGLSEAQAVELVRARWPMCGLDALTELAHRGLALTIEDLDAWIAKAFKRKAFPDGVPVDATSIILDARLVDEFLAWAIAHRRGEPTAPIPEPPATVLTVVDMIQGLRSEDMTERARHGFALASAVGAGLRLSGERSEDVEHLIGPEIASRIGRAIAGESAAVAELAELLTDDARHAFRPGDHRSTAPAEHEALSDE